MTSDISVRTSQRTIVSITKTNCFMLLVARVGGAYKHGGGNVGRSCFNGKAAAYRVTTAL
jgi:hypothetical protein